MSLNVLRLLLRCLKLIIKTPGYIIKAEFQALHKSPGKWCQLNKMGERTKNKYLLYFRLVGIGRGVTSDCLANLRNRPRCYE